MKCTECGKELTAEEQGKFEHSAALLKENFESIKEKCTL